MKTVPVVSLCVCVTLLSRDFFPPNYPLAIVATSFGLAICSAQLPWTESHNNFSCHILLPVLSMSQSSSRVVVLHATYTRCSLWIDFWLRHGHSLAGCGVEIDGWIEVAGVLLAGLVPP